MKNVTDIYYCGSCLVTTNSRSLLIIVKSFEVTDNLVILFKLTLEL